MFVHFKRRDFSEGIELPGLRIEVERMRWQATGGPDTASLIVNGSADALWELVELLRCPVEVYDDARAEPVWWGYVARAEVQRGRIRVRAGLDEMANQVTVVYSNLLPGQPLVGARMETQAANDSESQAAYGVKALRYPTGGANLAQATALRDQLLQARRWPAPGVAIEGQEGALGRLELKGWWHCLEWSYYAQPAGRELNEMGGQQDWIGAQAADTRYAQSFELASLYGWDADRVWIKAKTIGGPQDNLVVDLCANNGGVPGTVLASGTLPGPAIGISTAMRLFEILFNQRVSLSTGVVYWLVVRRSGGIDGMNYYMVDTDQSGGAVYPRGALSVWNGVNWSPHNPGADLWFRISGTQETTTQLAAMLGTCPFFSGVDLEVRSGVWTSLFRLGENRTRTEVEELLKTGMAGGRRLLAAVSPGRRIRVYAEPIPGVQDWGLFANGSLRDAGDQPVQPWRGPVGVWARLRDIVPGSADVSRLADVSRVFIDWAEWDVKSGLRIGPR